ncbi:Syntaxin-binding protein 4 [Trichoplax sp. H2]|nr:Syntaxin-binding protein 4 [Trichoplax sp. H2]|eukprot:RDD37865.1 Syntaxin-binding protein 4 [Trichoplax sp. H2]
MSQSSNSKILRIHLKDCSDGIGVRIIGGTNSAAGRPFGIFIKALVSDKAAKKSGQLLEGDLLLKVNGIDLQGISSDKAVSILKSASQSDDIKLIIARGGDARAEYERLLAGLSGKLNGADGSKSNWVWNANGKTMQPVTSQNGAVPEYEYVPSGLPNGYKSNHASYGDNKRPYSISSQSRSSQQSFYSDFSATPEKDINSSNQDRRSYMSTSMPKLNGSPGSYRRLDSQISIEDRPSTNSGHRGNQAWHSSPPSGNKRSVSTDRVDRGSTNQISSQRHDLSGNGQYPSMPNVYQQGKARQDRIDHNKSSERSTSLSATGNNSRTTPIDSRARFVVINKTQAGLGLSLTGGSGQPLIVEEIVPGGDVYKASETSALHYDGRMRKGDHIVSIMGEQLVDVTKEYAKSIITRLKLRDRITEVEIGFIRNSNSPHAYNRIQSISNSSLNSSFSAVAGTYLVNEGRLIQSRQPYGDSSVASSRASLFSSPTRNSLLNSRDFDSRNTNTEPELDRSPQPDLTPSPTSPPTRYHHDEISPPRRNGDIKMEKPQRYPSPPASNIKSEQERKLAQDLKNLAEGTHQRTSSFSDTASNLGGLRPALSSTLPLNDKLALDPTKKIKVEKMELALKYLGLEPTEEEQKKLRRRILADPSGYITYGEFVRAAREVFRFQLPPANDSVHKLKPKSLGNRTTDGSTTRLSSASLSQLPTAKSSTTSVSGSTARFLPKPISVNIMETLENVRSQRDQAYKEIDQLKVLLQDNERSMKAADNELFNIRQDVEKAIKENQDLRKRIQLQNEAHTAAKQIESEYEALVKNLTNDVSKLKNSHRALKQSASNEIRKQMSILECELKKAEQTKQNYEAATEKLLAFVQTVKATLSEGGDTGTKSQYPRPPGKSIPEYPNKDQNNSILKDVKTILKTVKPLLEFYVLPYGWSEAIAADGQKYYMNHITQKTSWERPVQTGNTGSTDELIV